MFTLYMHIKVEWVGCDTPTSGHPARHMANFCETFETVESFPVYDQSVADALKRRTENIYGPMSKVVPVTEAMYREIETRICNACAELDEMERLFV